MAVTQNLPSVNKGSSSVGPMVAEYWQRTALQALYPTLNFIDMAREGGKNAWITIPKRTGDKVNFYREPIEAADYTTYNESADDPSPGTWVLTAVTAQASQYLASKIIPDLSEGIALKSVVERVSKALAYKAVRTFNGLVGGEISANGTAKFCNDATSAADITATDTLTPENLDTLAMYLHSNDVRTYPGGNYKYRCHPVGIKGVRADTGSNSFWELVKYTNPVTGKREEFMVGRLSGFEIKETTEVVSTSAISGTGYAFYNLWSGYESIGALNLGGGNLPGAPSKGTGQLIKRPGWEPSKSNFNLYYEGPESGGTADPHHRRASVAYKMWTAAKVLRTICCGVHVAGSTYSSAGE